MSPARLGTPERPGTTADHINYLFYEKDPGVPMPAFNDLSQVPDKTRQPPEYAWWEFDIDDVTSGKGDLMISITEATDPDLSRFLLKNNGKLIIYHSQEFRVNKPNRFSVLSNGTPNLDCSGCG